jgi:hypothetical protein
MTQLQTRLARLEQKIAARQRQQIVVQITEGKDDPDEVLDRMIASGEITEHQRADVRFIQWRIVAPVWEMSADGGARLVGRRNVHTGEVEKVEWGDQRTRSTSEAV